MRLVLPALALVGLAAAGCGRSVPVVPADAAARAKAMAARGDTVSALALLDTIVRSDRQNASAWHARGMLAWARLRSLREQPGKMMPAKNAMQWAADSSLRLAARFAPDSARFALDLGRYFMYTGIIQLRAQAPAHFRQASEAARRTGDRATLAEAQDELGMIDWRRYENVANRKMVAGSAAAFNAGVLNGRPHSGREFFRDLIHPLDPSVGELDYRHAVAHFDTARAADPRNRRAARHNFMSLAAPEHWVELRRAAEAQLAGVPGDPDALLARGLAAHRLGDERTAAASFEVGLAALPDAERRRLTSLTRLLRPSDSVTFNALDAASRAEAERMFWAQADPLTLTPENEHRLEFLSRVTFAELMWSSEDLGVRGSDSDRGVTHIRYGPPRHIASFAPDMTRSTTVDQPLSRFETVDVGTSSTIWYYEDLDLGFVFSGAPSYGTSRFAGEYASRAADRAETMPWSWGNLRLTRMMDTVGLQLARFRGPGDSVDLAIHAELPVRRMTAGVELVNGPLEVAMTLYDSLYRTMQRDSTREVVTFANAAAARRAWRRRLPARPAAVRVEAWQGDAARGARATSPLKLEPRRGFGMSDVLVADRAQPRGGSAAARWTDLLIVPSTGVLRRRQGFGVVWETYDLATDADGRNRYRIELSLTVIEVARPTALIWRIVGGVADAIGTSAKGDDQVMLAYTRERDASPAAVDYLTVELADAPAGRYLLTVAVTDLVRNTRASSGREVRVVD
jgi:GWxTD domain-containing protein